jgi:hypothetical protein
MAKPHGYSEEYVKSLEDAFKNGANIVQACLLSRISRETYYNWCEQKKGFLDRMTTAQEYPSVIARLAVVKAIGEEVKNPSRNGTENSWKWLERKNKDEFSSRSELTGKDGKDLPTPILAHVSSDNSNN